MYQKILSFLLLFLASFHLQSQVDFVIKTDKTSKLDTVAVLIDKNYSFQEILSNPNLQFTKQSKIKVKDIDNYWVKCTVSTSFAYDKTFSIWTSPPFDSELYYFNLDDKKWQSVRGGEMVANNTTNLKYMPCIFKANESTTIYIKVNVSEINQSNQELETTIFFENQTLTIDRRKTSYDWWLSTIAIVLAFLIYNLYWYVMIREKVYLYYLMILSGGILYITCAGFFLSYFISIKNINAVLHPEGYIIYSPIEYLILRISAVLVILGILQFTRLYLQSKRNFPTLDKLLMSFFWLFTAVTLIINTVEYFKWVPPIDNHDLVINSIIFIILILIIIIGFKSNAQKIREAKYFLAALFIPLLLIISLVISLIISQNNTGLYVLPNLAILSITITFAIALVAKVNLIKKELITEKYEKQAAVVQNEMEKERILRLQEKIEYDKNEVAAAQHIKLLMKELHHRVKNNLQIVSSLLSLQSFRIKDQAAIDAVKEGQHRIEAMSLIHQKLYIQDNITQVNIREFITDIAESLMEAYGFNKHNFQLEIYVSEELLDVDKAIPLSIIINELITNAFKYAYTSIKNPTLKISFTKKYENATLLVSDNGIGMDVEAWKNNDGYGKELVNTFTEQLSGTLTLSVNDGITFQIDFPF